MTKEIKIKLYTFDELSDTAKKFVYEKYRDSLVEYNSWYDSIEQDAKMIGLKLIFWNLDDQYKSNNYLFLLVGLDAVMTKILENHDSECDTYKLAKTYFQEKKKLGSDFNGDSYINQLKKLYWLMLKNEYNYLISDRGLAEHFIDTETWFYENGQKFIN